MSGNSRTAGGNPPILRQMEVGGVDRLKPSAPRRFDSCWMRRGYQSQGFLQLSASRAPIGKLFWHRVIIECLLDGNADSVSQIPIEPVIPVCILVQNIEAQMFSKQ